MTERPEITMRTCFILLFCATILHVAPPTAAAGVVVVTPKGKMDFDEKGQTDQVISFLVTNNTTSAINVTSLSWGLLDEIEHDMNGGNTDNDGTPDDFAENIHFTTIDKTKEGVINKAMDMVTYAPPITIASNDHYVLNQVLSFDIPADDKTNPVKFKDVGLTAIEIDVGYKDANAVAGTASEIISIDIFDAPEPGTTMIWCVLAIIFGGPVVRNRLKRTQFQGRPS
jgi:hypothetical protein